MSLTPVNSDQGLIVYETMTLFQMKTLRKLKMSTKNRFIEQDFGESSVALWRNYLTLLLNRQPRLLGMISILMISSGSLSGLCFTNLVINSLVNRSLRQFK